MGAQVPQLTILSPEQFAQEPPGREPKSSLAFEIQFYATLEDTASGVPKKRSERGSETTY